MQTIPRRSASSSQTQRIPPRQTRATTLTPRVLTRRLAAASQPATRGGSDSLHRPGPFPPPATPPPSARRRRHVAAAHRARGGRGTPTASSRSAPPTSAPRLTSREAPTVPPHPPRPRRTDAARAGTETDGGWQRAGAPGGGACVAGSPHRPPLARQRTCIAPRLARPRAHTPAHPRGARGRPDDRAPTGDISC